MPAGRPTDYTLEIAAEICATLCTRKADGQFHSLRDACADLGIAERTVYQWLDAHTEFSQMYARARKERADLMAHDIVEIADTDPDPQRARVRIDARKWYAGRLNPKVWGDKLMGDPENPLVHEVKDESSLAELRSRLARLTSRGAEGSGSSDNQ